VKKNDGQKTIKTLWPLAPFDKQKETQEKKFIKAKSPYLLQNLIMAWKKAYKQERSISL